jgi:hypothetical protein
MMPILIALQICFWQPRRVYKAERDGINQSSGYCLFNSSGDFPIAPLLTVTKSSDVGGIVELHLKSNRLSGLLRLD